MRVAFVTSESGLGGGETSLLNLMRAGRAEGWYSLLVCPAGSLSRAARALGIEVHEVEFPDAHLVLGLLPCCSVRGVRVLSRVFRDLEVDVVHVESFLGLVYGGIAARFLRIPCVATYHGYWKLGSPVARMLVSACCERVYPVSRAVDIDFADWFDRRHIVQLGFGSEFRAVLPERSVAREELGLSADARIVLQVGRFQSIKGQLNLLRAAKEMVAMGWQRLLVLFAGAAPNERDRSATSYWREVSDALRSRRLAGRVRLLGHCSNVPLLMRAADVVVCPSEFETFGVNVVEAMAVGTPVVATRAGALAELIDDNVTGRLVPAGSYQALASCIAEILSDRYLARRLASRARDAALERYAPEIRAQKLASEYRRLLASREERPVGDAGSRASESGAAVTSGVA